MKSDIVKGKDTLENHHKYAAFLEIMTPDDIENPSQFFDVPQKMTDCLEKTEAGNFPMIRAYLFYDKK
jgi:hypothetical protein